MKEKFYKSPSYAAFFIVLDIFINALFITIAIISIYEKGRYVFDFTWMAMYLVVFFGIIFNVHFIFLGVFRKVIITEDSIQMRRIFIIDGKIKWVNVKDIRIVKEMRQPLRAKEISMIIIEGYDEKTKLNIEMHIDYREKVYDCIIDNYKNAREKSLERINKYFK